MSPLGRQSTVIDPVVQWISFHIVHISQPIDRGPFKCTCNSLGLPINQHQSKCRLNGYNQIFISEFHLSHLCA